MNCEIPRPTKEMDYSLSFGEREKVFRVAERFLQPVHIAPNMQAVHQGMMNFD